jgi:hypothetical protein
MSGFEKLIELLDDRYYGDLIMAIFELIAIIVGLLHVRKDKIAIFFLGYLIFDLLILIWGYYLEISPFTTNHEYSVFVAFTNTLISLVELLVYYYFFFSILRNKNMIKVLKTLGLIFCLIEMVFIITGFNFLTIRYSYASIVIGVIELLFLIPPCFAYFFELLTNDPIINLFERPSFWIVTGIFFYSVISIPSYLIDRFVNHYHYQVWGLMNLLLFYIPIAINSVFFIKAFLCKKTLTI